MWLIRNELRKFDEGVRGFKHVAQIVEQIKMSCNSIIFSRVYTFSHEYTSILSNSN